VQDRAAVAVAEIPVAMAVLMAGVLAVLMAVAAVRMVELAR
jgi:hypothetical protein